MSQQTENQIKAIKEATDKACQSKEAAKKFLKDAGIINSNEQLQNKLSEVRTNLKLNDELVKMAEEYADSVERRGCAHWSGLRRGFIAGIQKATEPVPPLIKDNKGEELKEDELWEEVKVKTLIEIVWFHGHKCGCLNERLYKDAPMKERMQIAGTDFSSHIEEWIESFASQFKTVEQEPVGKELIRETLRKGVNIGMQNVEKPRWEGDYNFNQEKALKECEEYLESLPATQQDKGGEDKISKAKFLLERAYQLHPLREGQNILKAGMTFDEACKLFKEIKHFLDNH